MTRLITFLAVFLTTFCAQAGDVAIFSGNYAKMLKQNINLFDQAYIVSAAADPTGAGYAAPIGSVYLRLGTGGLFSKTGAGNTAWTNVLLGTTGWTLTGNAGTTPGTNFLGTTDGQDLVFKTNNTERLRITSAGVYDTTLGLGILHADASGLLSSSQVALGSEVSGTLPTGNGGTGLASIGAANQILGVDASATTLEYKSVTGTANRLSVTHAANSVTLNVDTTFLPSPLVGDTNKTLIASGANASSWQLIANANLAAAGVANIARDKLASGTADHVLINDASGVVSSEARLSLLRTADGAANNVLIGAGLGSSPTYGLIADANVSGTAAIARSKVAAGTANHVLINDGSGNLSSEARLSLSRFKDGTSGLPLLAQGVGSDPIYTALSLSGSGVTGTLPIGSGGTGQVTATAAFDALSPLTTKGDLLTRNNANNIRVGVGSDGQTLIADSAQASGLRWGTPSGLPTIFGTRQTGRTIVAGTGITSGASHMSTSADRQLIFVSGTSGVDITASPQIEAGTNVGQEMQVCGTSDTNWVLLEDGTGLALNGEAMLGKDDCVTLNWLGSDGTTSNWVERARNF